MDTVKPKTSLETLLNAWSFSGFISLDDAADRLRSDRTRYFGMQFIHVFPGFPLTGNVKPGKLGHFLGLCCADGRWIVSGDGSWHVTSDVEALFRLAQQLLTVSGAVERFRLVHPRFFRYVDHEAPNDRSEFDAFA